MGFLNRRGWGRTLLLAAAVAVAGAAFTSSVSAQGYDTAFVPFKVNVNATVSATDGVTPIQLPVTANQVAILRIPIQKTSSVLNLMQRQPNTQVTISSLGGRVTVSLPAKSYSNSEILLSTVNGKCVLRSNVSASREANSISHPNLATGVYLLSVRGAVGNTIASRLTHNGGMLNIRVVFGGEGVSSGKRLVKGAAAVDWTITVSASGYVDSTYSLRPTAGTNIQQNITLRMETSIPEVPKDVTATSTSSSNITVTWSASSGATGYFVYRRTKPSDNDEIVGTTLSLSYVDKELTSGTTYYYRVSAYNSNGDESPLSSEISATTQAIPTFIDSRDNKEYKTATIGGKTWMAENLNYDPQKGNSWCYRDSDLNCIAYGRLYDWATMMNINVAFNNALLGGSDVKRQGVCPAGWHLPSVQEWDNLTTAVGGSSTAGKKLKSTSGWNVNGKGTDEYGFSALSGGRRYPDGSLCDANAGGGSFCDAGYGGYWWTATEDSNSDAFRRCMDYSFDRVHEDNFNKSFGFSVRCVKDD